MGERELGSIALDKLCTTERGGRKDDRERRRIQEHFIHQPSAYPVPIQVAELVQRGDIPDEVHHLH